MRMTPEERFTRIENFLSTVAGHQAQMAENHRLHDAAILELREMHKGLVVAVAKTAEAQRMLTEAQRSTEERLNALIQTVDRIISNQKRSQN
jgi:hypothetical protein